MSGGNMKYFTFLIVPVILLFYACTLEGSSVLGPAGGYVFFDKGNYSDGWRYLEASLEDAGVVSKDYFIGEISKTSTAMGSGRQNTDIILAAADVDNEKINGVIKAAQLCLEFNFGGYNDWFLPSIDELNQMKDTNKRKFSGAYLSSSYSRFRVKDDWVNYDRSIFLSNFNGASLYKIRPVRRF
jgi:hypothetical protein